MEKSKDATLNSNDGADTSGSDQSKSLEDIPFITTIPLRRNKSDDNISQEYKVNVKSIMHDDSNTQVFEATKKIKKRISKPNLDLATENSSKTLSVTSTKVNALPPPVRLEFSPDIKRKSPLPGILKKRSSSLNDAVTSTYRIDSSNSASNTDSTFDDNNRDINTSTPSDDVSTLKGSLTTITANSDINFGNEDASNLTVTLSDSETADRLPKDFVVQDSPTRPLDLEQSEDEILQHEMNAKADENLENVNIEEDNTSKQTDGSVTQRAITPFFLKQVDISDAILKVDPQLTKDLSLISINSPSKKPRKSRGESCVSHGSSAYSRSSTAIEGNASNVRVTVRVRPMSSLEKQRGDQHVIEFPGDGGIWVENAPNQTKPFTFNAVFQEDCSQELVFHESGITDLIDKALDGFSCTAFAFGQTGSGKTYTITGPPDQSAEDMLSQGGSYGMVPRAFRYLFEKIGQRTERTYCVKASFLEVYNEKVKDLLHPSNVVDSLPLRWSSKTGFYVDNLFMMECDTVEELMETLIKGSTYRQVGEHAINDHSSRSHTMLTVYVHSEEVDTDEETNGFVIAKRGKVSFVDLAGSEKVKETKTTGETLVESNNINKSLLTLGNCISGLGDPRKKGQHIPYRESKLTKLLADSLGGEGFTLMIACISPSSHVLQDTMNTLRYANRAKNIKNKPVVKMDPKEQLLHRMKRELKLLRAENLYFRQQLGVPYSEAQVIMTPSQIKGELTPNEHSGTLSPAIGNGTFSSTQSSRNSSSKELGGRSKEDSFTKDDSFTPRATTALYALGAKNGLYTMLQEYMNENASLKTENMELHRTRAVARHQQEELFRENDRLAKKLEDVGRVMLSTPVSRDNIRSWISRGTPEAEIFTRQKTEDTLILETGSIRSNGSGIRFPPVRQGTYPNFVLDQDAVAELQKEKSKLQERERILLERSEKLNVSKLSSDVNKTDNVGVANRKFTDGNTQVNNKENIEKKKGEKKQIVTSSSETSAPPKKQEGRFKKTVLSKAWKSKKKATSSNEKPSSYAAQFAVRKNLLSKQPPNQSVNNRTEIKEDSVPVDHSIESTEPTFLPQQFYATPQHPGIMQQQYPHPHVYQMHNPNAYYPPAGNYVGPYAAGEFQGPYQPTAPDINGNQRLQHDLTSLNGQIHQEIKTKKAKPKR